MDLIKAESEAEMRNNILSEWLVIEILVRLPVISLLRFKCVCKSWRSLISSPFFIEKHLQVCNSTTKSPPNLLIKIRPLHDSNLESLSLLSYNNPLDLEAIEALPFTPVSESSIVGSCNGVVCLHKRANGNLVLWNPATRETKDVPRSHIQRSDEDFDDQTIGFCFDVNSNDYRVVMIHACTRNDPMRFQLEVYSLSTDSWRLVTAIQSMDLELWTSGLYMGGLYVGGMCSWLASKKEFSDYGIFNYGEGEIMSFDIRSEMIIRTPFPESISIYINDEQASYLVVYKEYLAIIDAAASSQDGRLFDIWVLREVGVVDSWAKLFTIGPLHYVPPPLVLWDSRLLLWKKKRRELFFHDYTTKQNTRLGIFGNRCRMQIVNYKESLVQIRSEN